MKIQTRKRASTLTNRQQGRNIRRRDQVGQKCICFPSRVLLAPYQQQHFDHTKHCCFKQATNQRNSHTSIRQTVTKTRKTVTELQTRNEETPNNSIDPTKNQREHQITA